MREKGQTEVAKTLETPVFSRGIEILTEKVIFYVRFNKEFQSTRPSRGETRLAAATAARWRHFNPLAPRGARPAVEATQAAQEAISIHSPLAGRDGLCSRWTSLSLAFQSTRPSRGETLWAKISHCTALSFQSTRPSRGETRCNRGRIGLVNQFQSTRPSRGETIKLQHFCSPFIISIHSPLAGRDVCIRQYRRNKSDFNPLAPRGARPEQAGFAAWRANISIHSPLAGRDPREKPKSPVRAFFSIHSPLARRDCALDNRAGAAVLFNPLAPCGARPMETFDNWTYNVFSIHSPLAGRDKIRCRQVV